MLSDMMPRSLNRILRRGHCNTTNNIITCKKKEETDYNMESMVFAAIRLGSPKEKKTTHFN